MALRGFSGLAHRVEYVGEINGIRFYNDSKATNVDATRMAIEGMEAEVIIIAGGKAKGGSYKVIKDLMKKVKAMVAIGEARQRIKEELGDYTDIYLEEELEGAVKKAYQLATKGDVILLSPMCSSFDMFKDYKERGDLFKALVRGL
jgi:UDP-N-acetylmuramoylalanine--D-glutamate ligase